MDAVAFGTKLTLAVVVTISECGMIGDIYRGSSSSLDG